MEIAYEWTWEEGQNMLEILEMRKELERREQMKTQAQSSV